MERTRDLFCFMCLSGIRFSEIQDLKKEDIDGEEIRVRNKGGNIRRLPMNQFTHQIYRNYENRYYLDNSAFPQMSNITMNKYLRMIGMEVGLERKVPAAPRPVAGREYDSSANWGETARVPLYTRLTAGIAVNTFIANALQLDIPVEIISGYTGVQHDIRIRHLKAELAVEEMKKFDRRQKIMNKPVRGAVE
jgi:hypothetical protein